MKLPQLKREQLSNRALVGECLLFFIKSDSFCKELENQWMQELAQEGFLQSFCKVFFRSEPKTLNLIPWFMDRMATDLLLQKDSSQWQFKDFIDMLSKHDLNFLEQVYKLSEKYKIAPEQLKNDFRHYLKAITDKEDLSAFLFALFSDGVFHAEIRILSYYYEEWFGLPYKF